MVVTTFYTVALWFQPLLWKGTCWCSFILAPHLEEYPAGVQTLHCYLSGHVKGSRGERMVYHLSSVQMEDLQPKLKSFCQNCKV